MTVLYVYCAIWVAVPLGSFILAPMAGVPRKWRASVSYAATIIGLMIAAILLQDPLKMFLDTIDPEFYPQVISAEAGDSLSLQNYYLGQIGKYSILALGMGFVTFVRPQISMTLTTVQFWLFHLGVLTTLLPLAWWALNQTSGLLSAPTNRGAWSVIIAYGSLMVLASVVILFGLILWVFLSKGKPQNTKNKA